MWLFTSSGCLDVGEDLDDRAEGCLTVRAPTRLPLEALRARPPYSDAPGRARLRPQLTDEVVDQRGLFDANVPESEQGAGERWLAQTPAMSDDGGLCFYPSAGESLLWAVMRLDTANFDWRDFPEASQYRRREPVVEKMAHPADHLSRRFELQGLLLWPGAPARGDPRTREPMAAELEVMRFGPEPVALMKLRAFRTMGGRGILAEYRVWAGNSSAAR